MSELSQKMLIITGCGFSGTKFIAKLFQIKHEPRGGNDAYAYWKCWNNPEKAEEYIRETFKGDERESNSFLVPFVPAILKLFPEANVFHLIRNPKDVIRSQMSGGQYAQQGNDLERKYRNIKLDIENWDKLSRFEKVCWWWKITNQRLKGLPIIRIEDMRGKPIHTGEKEFPEYENWNLAEKKVFHKIIKPKEYGYNSL